MVAEEGGGVGSSELNHLPNPKRIDVTLALKKPDWSKQKFIEQRPLWEVAALACDAEPNAKVTSARKKFDEQWAETYARRLSAMCDALSSSAGLYDISYDKSRPANQSRIHVSTKLKFVRVNAASAINFVIWKFGLESLPPEFRELHKQLMQTSVQKESKSDVLTEQPSTDRTTKKSQEKANETKASNVLRALLYLVVEHEMGWTDADGAQRNVVLEKFKKYMESHTLKSAYGTSKNAIEDALCMGEDFAPRRSMQT